MIYWNEKTKKPDCKIRDSRPEDDLMKMNVHPVEKGRAGTPKSVGTTIEKIRNV